MMRLFLMAALFLAAATCRAQSLDGFKARLTQSDSLSSARVQVVEHGSAAELVRQLAVGGHGERISGYRVRIFFDNSQNARGMAAAAMGRFQQAFPDIPVYMSYENPYFKVVVGNCVSHEEAIILKGRVEGEFDRAFISREDIPMSVLGQ